MFNIFPSKLKCNTRTNIVNMNNGAIIYIEELLS